MKLRKLGLGLAVGTILAATATIGTTSAQTVNLSALSYRTGPFGSNGKVIANGARD